MTQEEIDRGLIMENEATGQLSILFMIGIIAIALMLGLAIDGEHRAVSIWVASIGVLIYLVNTVWLLTIYKHNSERMAFDFSGYYTDRFTHAELLIISVVGYVIIRIMQFRRYQQWRSEPQV